MTHKFKVGQTVYFTPGRGTMLASGQAYEVVRCLPRDGGQYQYRIKCKAEAFERLARESELGRNR